jgi:hypothetical protein
MGQTQSNGEVLLLHKIAKGFPSRLASTDLRRSVFGDEQQLRVDLTGSPSHRRMTGMCAQIGQIH